MYPFSPFLRTHCYLIPLFLAILHMQIHIKYNALTNRLLRPKKLQRMFQKCIMLNPLKLILISISSNTSQYAITTTKPRFFLLFTTLLPFFRTNEIQPSIPLAQRTQQHGAQRGTGFIYTASLPPNVRNTVRHKLAHHLRALGPRGLIFTRWRTPPWDGVVYITRSTGTESHSPKKASITALHCCSVEYLLMNRGGPSCAPLLQHAIMNPFSSSALGVTSKSSGVRSLRILM
jgi:hypothetical protein